MTVMDAPKSFDPGQHSLFRRIVAVIRLRCPRCCRGAAWRAPFRMHEQCPVCGLAFERGAGYFTGAMYASYTIGIFGTLPVWMWMLVAGASLAAVVVVATALVVLLMPVSFHYSRVAWLHLDCYFNPEAFVG